MGNNFRTETLQEFSKQTVFFPSYQFAYSQLQKAVEATDLRKTASCTFLVGQSGTGKSRLCELFKNSFGPRQEKPCQGGVIETIPALYCLVPAPVTIKGICITLLKELGVYAPHPNVHALNGLLVERLKKCEVKVLILDEIQRLLKPDAERARDVTLEWIVALLSICEIPIMLSGTEECESLINDEGGRDQPPFARRYCYNATLEYFKFSELASSEYYLTLKVLDENLYHLANFIGDIHLQDLSIMAPLYVASVGNLEYLRQIIYEAASIALTRTPPALKRIDFVDACRCLSLPKNLKNSSNPFNLPLSESLELIGKYDDEQAYLRSHPARGGKPVQFD